MSDRVFAEIESEKGVYIGDICYAMQDKLYDGIWCGKHHCEDGCFEIPGSMLWFAVGGTAYGDGAYEGSNGLVFPVDAGVIGVLPLELCKENRDEYSDCGIIIDESGTVTFESEDGVFEIELPDGNRFTIDTKYEDEEDADSWWEEDDE